MYFRKLCPKQGQGQDIGRVPTDGFVVAVTTVIAPDTTLIFRPLNSVPGKTETTL